MKHGIIHTVQKLIALSRGTGPEAKVARERAEHLMAKYNLVVSIDHNYRLAMPGVRGALWKEHLLGSVARYHGVKALRSTDNKQAMLAGDEKRVLAARETFYCLSVQIGVQAARGWEDYRRWYRLGVPVEVIDESEVFWQKVYTDTVAMSLSRKLDSMRAPPPKRPEPRYEQGVLSPEVVRARQAIEAEQEERRLALDVLKQDAQEVKELLGDQFQSLVNHARTAGKNWPDWVPLVAWQPEVKLLTSASSFLPPPPEPSRFNQLDIDW